jgi:excisionase family DNA binding protein
MVSCGNRRPKSGRVLQRTSSLPGRASISGMACWQQLTSGPLLPVPQSESDGRQNLASAARVKRYLGVSRSTLMRYIADRKIEAVKMDGGWRFDWAETICAFSWKTYDSFRSRAERL